jgi:GNAT superfamily N-acetyltransferase
MGQQKRNWIADYLRRQIERGGSVVGAFYGDTLVGFCSIDSRLLGRTAKYANLTMLFVDDRFKRKGIGKRLFNFICACAKEMNADKIFISAVSSVETIEFYFRMGCKDASQIIPEYIDTETDRYLELSLT